MAIRIIASKSTETANAVSTEQHVYPPIYSNREVRSFQYLLAYFFGILVHREAFIEASDRMVHECLCQLRILISPFLRLRGDIRFRFQTCSDVFNTFRAPGLIIQRV